MFKRNETIGGWQTGILLFVLFFANKILVLPSLLYDQAGIGGIYVPVILFLFEFALLFLFYGLKKKYPEQSFGQILKKFGKFVYYLIFVFLMFYFLGKAVLLYNITYIFFKNIIYKDTSNILFLFCFLPIMIHLAVSGLRVMGRTMQLFFPIILIMVVFCIVVGVLGIDTNTMLFTSKSSDVFLSTFRHISAFGDTIFLFVVMDKINVKKGEWKVVFSLAGLSAICVIAVCAIFIFSYTYTSYMHPFALFEIMSYVKETGGIGRIDIISVVVIIILTYFHLAICMKGFLDSFVETFKLNNIYGSISFQIVFLILINYLVLNVEKAISYGEVYLPYISAIPFVIIPIFAIISLFFKKREGRK